MKIPLFQIDAFADRLFSGNPAAVCLLPNWIADETMQAIAAENNLSETAFLVREGEGYRIRWFTPQVEVDLCGHATLAAAHVLMNYVHDHWDQLTFQSRSGELKVAQNGNDLTLDFPTDVPAPVECSVAAETALGATATETWLGRSDLMLVYDNENQIRSLQPDMRTLAKVNSRAVMVTAPGEDCDFVSRFFAPMSGIDEDPVTGSAHTTLTPFWAQRLGKSKMNAKQISARGGKLICELVGDRVKITGTAITYLQGEITIP